MKKLDKKILQTAFNLGIMTSVDYAIFCVDLLDFGGELTMPQIDSAIKRVRTNEKAGLKNAAQTSAMKTAVKKFEEAVAAKSENVEALYLAATSAVDKAETKGLIHKNKAGRDKARMTRQLASVK